MIALAAAGMAILLPSTAGQVLAICIGGTAGCYLPAVPPPPGNAEPGCPISRSLGLVLLLSCAGLLPVLMIGAALSGGGFLAAFAEFYRAGLLVFGGGHVVLPVLQASVVAPGWVSNDTFLAGYGAAQAVPGPLFTFAGFLGAVMAVPPGGWLGGFLMIFAIFLPSFLMVPGALPFWAHWRRHDAVRRALAGINAAVVGILAAALYDPVWTSAIQGRVDILLALVAYALLVFGRLSPVLVAFLTAGAAWTIG